MVWKWRDLIPGFLLMILIFAMVDSPYCVLAVEPNEPHQSNALWMEPSTTLLRTVGEKFNLTVWVNITEECFAWQLKILFNSTYFAVSRIGYADIEKSDFFSDHQTITITPVIESSQGYIIAGETLLENDTRTPGFGSLLWIEFSLKSLPTASQFDFSFSAPYGADTFVLNPYLDTIAIEHVDGTTVSIFHPEDDFLRDLIIIAVIIVVLILVAILVVKRRGAKPNE
ncbi:MAG: hypothetical protein ACFFDQ_12530 [Candidatus Thorarchaeota archaeon]